MRRPSRVRALLAAAALAAAPAAAQQPATPDAGPLPFLLINQERLLTGSEPGRALLEEEEEARDRLRAEARAIDRRFEEEEQHLTELRAEMDPAAFRELADDFDQRVVTARREQDERSDALVAEFERRRRQFYADIAPILVALLSRYEAHAILDESVVLLADQSLNITDAVIAEIDRRFEPGDAVPEEQGAADAPEEQGAPQAPQEEGAPRAPQE